MKKIFEYVTTASYLFAALALAGMALTIMGWSVYEVIINLNKDNAAMGESIAVILQSVGSIVISVAIIDVAKYMVEEEVFRNKELRLAKEARETLTKIVVIIAIAVGIEGLVYIFKAGSKDITLLLYPACLVAVSGFLIIALGIYQKLSMAVEKTQKRKEE